MARAQELAVAERDETAPHAARLRDQLASKVRMADGIQETGHPNERLPGLASFVAPGLDGRAIAMALDLAGLACSTGSTCVSGSNEISHVLSAMGYPEEGARGALRFSIGRTTTEADIAEAADLIVATLAAQREAAERLNAERTVARASMPVVGVMAEEHSTG
jgi:cysteine desulfurase